MNVLLLSPYHGGSHAAWAAGYQQHSRHEVSLLTLPDRFWKWRMHGGAVTLARRFREQKLKPDVILATDMLDVTTFLALTRGQTHNVPLVLYMHENQLTYPLPEDPTTGPMRRQLGERDYHYAFINYASMLAADAVWFNSMFHLESWFTAVPAFLKHFPEYNELGTVAGLRKKSRVLPVGVDFEKLSMVNGQRSMVNKGPPLILWNQRWEYDKNPAAFFGALAEVTAAGIPFRLALCGQQYGQRPPTFDNALTQFADQLVHVGHADFETYRRLLWQADVVVSTAHHEFFGISLLEAIACRTFPLLPHRLSYPELIPAAYHADCLYHSQDELVRRLIWALSHMEQAKKIAGELSTAVKPFDWTAVAPRYDAALSEISLLISKR
jgi:glycosyltransferase involved in cell wall biosynthesis